MFQVTEQSPPGFISGQQAKLILLKYGLPQNVLAQIWNLADFDKDGKLSLEEFILAMHLCDYAKLGNVIPTALPAELIPHPRAPSQMAFDPISISPPNVPSNMFPNNINGLPGLGMGLAPAAAPLPPQAPNTVGLIGSFEDKRKENFDKGNAVLEAKRQQLREQEEREKREREEKERIEQEKKQKIKEEQDRRRQAEIEKQMERQRLLDLQREEERKKLLEQREAARNELIRQQRLEWEKQKKNELETQKLKLQEQLSTLKAKDKNLEYDMQILVINSYFIKGNVKDLKRKFITSGFTILYEYTSNLYSTKRTIHPSKHIIYRLVKAGSTDTFSNYKFLNLKN